MFPGLDSVGGLANTPPLVSGVGQVKENGGILLATSSESDSSNSRAFLGPYGRRVAALNRRTKYWYNLFRLCILI